MKIVSIGGGEIAAGETETIDRFICEISGVDKPRVLFIPTASGDAPGYCENFDSIYRDRLGCHVDHLLLLQDRPDLARVTELILQANVIYVGGGNTQLLLDTWRRLGVDATIKRAAAGGTVLSGLSAGAICWYEFGLSDSERFVCQEAWQYKGLPALGWLPGMFCPHLDAENRHGPLVDMVLANNRPAVACDNGAAIYWSGSDATVVTSLPGACAYSYLPIEGAVKVRKF